MEILSRPRFSAADWSYENQCSYCTTKVKINLNDIRYKKYRKSSCDPRDPTDVCEYDAELFYYLCPVCNREIEVKTAIPIMVIDEFREGKVKTRIVDELMKRISAAFDSCDSRKE